MGLAPKRFSPDNDLVNFDGKGKYSDPQFVWKQTIGPTALGFLNSVNLVNNTKTQYLLVT